MEGPFVPQSLVLLLALIFIGCSERPAEVPSSVPASARWIETAEEVYWLDCVSDSDAKEIKCRRWTKAGLLLYEAAYQPPEGFDWNHPKSLPLARMDSEESIDLTDGRELRFKRRLFPKD